MRTSNRAWMAAFALGTIGTAAWAAEVGVGHKAPPLEVAKWVRGEPAKLSDGNVMHVIEFWATW